MIEAGRHNSDSMEGMASSRPFTCPMEQPLQHYDDERRRQQWEYNFLLFSL
jgi:hypothetical protein